MKITIEYEASWRNSFLDGSNNELLPQKGRKYIASIKAIDDKPENFIRRDITKDTVMGVLNRLIGDQRKLYQARQDPRYYFADIEPILLKEHINDLPHKKVTTNELIYLRNISGSTDQESFTGMIKASHPVFNSPYSYELWSILWLSIDELCEFFNDESFFIAKLNRQFPIDPISILYQAQALGNLKSIGKNQIIENIAIQLENIFTPNKYIESSGKIIPMRLYAAALYIQLERLSKRFDMVDAYNQRGENKYFFGFSKRGFNGTRDFMKNFVTGGEKTVWGNPFLKKEFVSGEGKTTSTLTKASGTLEITLDIPNAKAKELNQMIENAGVSAFYLGKKGLAYVSDIKI